MMEEQGFSRRMMPAPGGILMPVLRRIAGLVGFGVATAMSAGFFPGMGNDAPTAAVAPALISTGHVSASRAQSGDREMNFQADDRGHFLIDASVNGAPVKFVLDTGASEVVIGADMARSLGLEPDTLAYTERLQTANGVADGAPVTLREIRIGSLSVEEVPAIVLRQPMPFALLGNTFLTRISGHQVHDGVLTLYW